MLKQLNQTIWVSGSGEEFLFSEIVSIIQPRVSSGDKLYIGSDSFVSNKKVNFVTALCLTGLGESRYFFKKENVPRTLYQNLVSRILEETRRSVEICEILIENNNILHEQIEIHLDVSPTHLNNGTSRFSEMLKGYVSAYGVSCKLKPNAWASQSVADKHSK